MSAAPSFPVLLDRPRILKRIHELARDIAARHPQPARLTLVSVIEGARVFCGHLRDALPWDVDVQEVRASSYGSGVTSSGRVQVTGLEAVDVRGRDVLLVEDIVDTGRTVARLGEALSRDGASSISVVTLLSKPSRREIEVALDHVGFEIEDRFVIGFGMDVDERYREIPHVAVYDAALERPAAGGATGT